MNKSFAIFDMDGTLVDSMEMWRDLAQEYLRRKGVYDYPEHLRAQVRSMTLSEAAALFLERFDLSGTVETMVGEMNRMVEERYTHDIPLKKKVKTHLDHLQRKGVRMCVASVTDPTLMRICLERLELGSYFEFMISCDEIKKSKRDPDIYLEAARRLGGIPDQVAVYEDALYAVKTAKEAGFHVIGVHDKVSEHEWEAICQLTDEQIAFD